MLPETEIPGLFAAGDVSTVPEKQIVIAAGEEPRQRSQRTVIYAGCQSSYLHGNSSHKFEKEV